MDNSVVHSLEIHRLPLWERLKQKGAPLSFTLEATARCNNDCRHCYINLPAGDFRAQAEELSLEEILSIAGQAVEMGALWCLVTGGEPLLRPDFADIYLGLRRKGLLVTVFTNATTIRQEHIDLFKRYPPRGLEVTVYGVTQATYEAVTRCTGSFAAFQRGLRLLLEDGVPVRLKTMALRSNLHELPLIADFCRRHTAGRYRFDPHLHLRYDGNPERNAEIQIERLAPEEIVALEQSDPERFSVMRKHCNELILEEAEAVSDHRLFHCGAGAGSFTVSYNGIFRLCDSLWAPGTTYDLRSGNLHEALFEFVSDVRALRSRSTDGAETCQPCSIVNLCLCCPAHTHLETGDMEGHTPYFCAVAHARARMLEGAMQECSTERTTMPPSNDSV
jgi:radical SAM protein with 4Fe4S-binding SPASM domain